MGKEHAATVYIECPITRRILAVSRKDNPNDYGLPGGHIEAGEDPARAAARELREETGAIIHHKALRPVFARKGCVTYEAPFFLITAVQPIGKAETGRISWVEPQTLIDGCFGKYNRRLLRALGRI